MTFACVFGLGIAIGLRYSLLALLPAIFGIICVFVAMDASVMDRVTSAILCAASIQGGYMVGLTARGLARELLSRFSAVFRST